MLQVAFVIASATLAGAASGALAAWLILRRRQRQPQAPPIPFSDPARIEEIEQAAAGWAHSEGRPEAAGLMADKLHLLHQLGQRRGWWR
jgi:hypothetical protein